MAKRAAVCGGGGGAWSVTAGNVDAIGAKGYPCMCHPTFVHVASVSDGHPEPKFGPELEIVKIPVAFCRCQHG